MAKASPKGKLQDVICNGREPGIILPGEPGSIYLRIMVDVAQLVESRIVIPVVVGSSPIVHPITSFKRAMFSIKSETSKILLTQLQSRGALGFCSGF